MVKIHILDYKISTFICLFVLAVVSLTLFSVDNASANNYGNDVGFFSGESNTNDTGVKVLDNGIPGSVTDKESFIAYIEGLIASNDGHSGENEDTVGAYFIVQTMRGLVNDNNTNFDRSYPDSNDMVDWRSKIRNSNITMSIENYSYINNSRRSNISNGVDINKYDMYQSHTERAVVFYGVNTGPLYAVKLACGNPVGALLGLPIPPPKDYNLTPSVSPDRITGEAGEVVSVVPKVENKGSASSQNTYSAISTMTFDSGSSVPSTVAEGDNGGVALYNTNKPCEYYKSQGAKNCQKEVVAGISNFSVGSNVMSSQSLPIGDYAAGTKFCYSLSVYSYNEATGVNQRWRHSVPICVVIAKKPKVQVLGGDLKVGRDLNGSGSVTSGTDTSTSVKTIDGAQRTFGSWIEYGIFATGTIKGTASGAAFAGKDGMANANICGYSILSFANVFGNGTSCVNDSSTIGNYTNAKSIPDIEASFPGVGTAISGNVNPGALGGGIYSAGDITLVASNLPKSKTIIIKATGTVTIVGDQKYDNGPYTNILGLPQLVIIANKIVINGSVSNVDAWLVAKGSEGTIETCEAVAKTVNECSNPLIVNGPVMAKKLDLRRTAGSGAGEESGKPAETFNLRADAYLWSAARATVNGRIQTVYTTELPPRL